MISYRLTTPPTIQRTEALPATRAMHLVDTENLLGGASFTTTGVAKMAAIYAPLADLRAGDHVVLASSHHAALATWFGWPEEARRVVRSGPDGADLALIEIIETENVARRFDRIVIASGDGIFAHPAARLQAAGVDVSVVSRREFLSRQLRFAVRDVRYLNRPRESAGAALCRSA